MQFIKVLAKIIYRLFNSPKYCFKNFINKQARIMKTATTC